MGLLLKNADLYTPIHRGLSDILIEGGKISKISREIKANCETIDCKGKVVCPMFVDGHEHISYTNYYKPKDIINSGVGTVVGCLANETSVYDVEHLIEIAKNLRQEYGIEAYCLAGSKNFTNDISKYIIENDCVVGIKTALLTNGRPKPNLSYEKLKQDTLSTYMAGCISNKKVQVHMHLDHPFPKGVKVSNDEINSGKYDNLVWLDKIVEETGIPYSIFKLTHVQKYCNRIFEYANKGCFIDYTAFDGEYDGRFNFLVNAIKEKRVNLDNISISSDLGILCTEKGLIRDETPITILNTVQKLVLKKGLKFEDVLKMVTTNALRPIVEKNELIIENDCNNLMILDENLEIEKIIYSEKLSY